MWLAHTSLEPDIQQNCNRLSIVHYCLPHVLAQCRACIQWNLSTDHGSIAACSERLLYVLRPATAECHTRRLAVEHSARPSHARNSSLLTAASSTQSKQCHCYDYYYYFWLLFNHKLLHGRPGTSQLTSEPLGLLKQDFLQSEFLPIDQMSQHRKQTVQLATIYIVLVTRRPMAH